MLSEQSIEKAVDWLRDNASSAASLRAKRVYAEEYRKSLKAILMKESGEESAAAKEMWAYAHPKYQAHLKHMAECVQADEENRAMVGAARIRIEAWQTMSANQRAVRL